MKDDNKIELSSRYNDVLTELEFIEGNRGIITTNMAFIRTICKDTSEQIIPEEERIEAIDFKGGPMISIGDIIKCKKIKNIRYVQLLEFE